MPPSLPSRPERRYHAIPMCDDCTHHKTPSTSWTCHASSNTKQRGLKLNTFPIQKQPHCGGTRSSLPGRPGRYSRPMKTSTEGGGTRVQVFKSRQDGIGPGPIVRTANEKRGRLCTMRESLAVLCQALRPRGQHDGSVGSSPGAGRRPTFPTHQGQVSREVTAKDAYACAMALADESQRT